MYDWRVVPAFGGGVTHQGSPVGIKDDAWTYASGFSPREGTAQVESAYEQIVAGASWLPATNEPIGIVQDCYFSDRVLVPVRHTGTSVVRLFQITAAGVASEIPLAGAGTAPTASDVSTRAVAMMVPTLFNGIQLLPCGTQGTHGILQYNGTDFNRVTPSSGNLLGRFCIAAGGHVVAAPPGLSGANAATVRVSDATALTEWVPSTANSADQVTLDAPGQIQGLHATQDGFLVITDSRIYMARSTGGIPPFTFTLVNDAGYFDARGLVCDTPYGPALLTPHGVYLGNSLYPPSLTIARSALQTVDLKLCYDSFRNELVIAPARTYIHRLNLATGAWSGEIPLPATVMDHTVTTRMNGSAVRHWCVTTAGTVYASTLIEADTTLDALASSTVSSKVFTFSDDGPNDYIDLLKVEWEAVESPASGPTALTVSAVASHEVFSSTTSGNATFDANYPASTVIGTLAAGASELPCRLRGRYVRLDFAPAAGSGVLRIRGFAMRRVRAAERAT